jgi:prepilin-type N-terminal cleavage/methylation domain-containing protein
VNTKKGFTLIELLVVIAIIGILSSVVLASLNTARAKGADAAIKANMANIRAQAEIVYDSKSCYADGTAGSCVAGAFAAAACAATPGTLFAEPTVAQQLTSAGNASSATGEAGANCVSTANQTAWAAATPLKADNTKSWCVDSTGASRQVTPAGADKGFAAAGAACK